jgi:inner membrane protein
MRLTHHFVLGFSATAAVLASTAPLWSLPLYAACGALAAVLPDLDARRSRLTRYHWVRLVAFTLFYLLGHRGLLHSVLGLLLFGVLFGLFWIFGGFILLPWAFGVGYLSHLLADSLTVSGVAYLYPYRRRFRLLPRKLCVRTGSATEEWLAVSLLILLLLTTAQQLF